MNIVVAMSGGVDSSVAAALLARAGHRVIGVTLKLLPGRVEYGCCGSTQDIDDARDVCARLKVPHYVMDFSDLFQKKVVEPFAASYLKGETPNPCIECNHYVKFGALFEKAKSLGADFVATGHYARVLKLKDASFGLFRAKDLSKDQSYVLYHLTQSELAKALFPLGDTAKIQVRETARELGLKVADKPDSQEICFVPQRDTAGYLKAVCGRCAATEPGPILDVGGKVLGKHRGAAYYTRGQREGLGISVGRPLYVVDVETASNTVVVGDDVETLSKSFAVRSLSWTQDGPPQKTFEALVQIRSRHGAASCKVAVNKKSVRVTTATPQRAVTPGQSAVFYAGDQVLGGGIIVKPGARD